MAPKRGRRVKKKEKKHFAQIELSDIALPALARELGVEPDDLADRIRSLGIRASVGTGISGRFAEKLRSDHRSLQRSTASPPARTNPAPPAHQPGIGRGPISPPHSSIEELIELARTRGVPKQFVRDQIYLGGRTRNEVREALESLPEHDHGDSPSALKQFKINLGISRLPFTVLPRGTAQHDGDLIAFYVRKYHVTKHNAHEFDFDRLTFVRSLGPTKEYYGDKAWRWYLVFEFQQYGAVVVECARKSNAAFIIWGEWWNSVQLTKAEVRSECRDRHVRITHQGDWKLSMRSALLTSSPI
jgi:hypothetical protein